MVGKPSKTAVFIEYLSLLLKLSINCRKSIDSKYMKGSFRGGFALFVEPILSK